MRKALWGWALCVLLGAAGLAQAQPKAIGLVKMVTGEATIMREGSRLVAEPGLPVLRGDVLQTGSPGTLGVILRDDTTLSLGSGSEVHMAEFVFEPAEGKLGMVLRVSRGVVSYLSGKIAKLAPEAARIETPVATLGIRGTRLAARITR
jgi:hypothetical protein